jgi:prefoldin subunit 2
MISNILNRVVTDLSVELQTQYSNYKSTLQQLAQKIGDIEQEAEEHKYVTSHQHSFFCPKVMVRAVTAVGSYSLLLIVQHQAICSRIHRLVLETLGPLSGDRKCFRMINGVLMECTIKDVIPQLMTNSEGLAKVLEDLLKQYKSKQVELDKWKVC